MRLLWLSNMAPAAVQQALGNKAGSGLWMDHVLEDLKKEADLSLHLLCPWEERRQGRLSEKVSFSAFQRPLPQILEESQVKLFREELKAFRPDVIHIWGTEFSHTLAMVKAAEAEEMLPEVVISIQGLCHFVGRHYLEGLPISVARRYTLRDLLRRDNLLHQQKIFYLRGEHEKQALSKVFHVMGRTHWDRACMRQLAPKANYHVCNETLRPCFYEGTWSYEKCQKHRIFTSSRLYPVKGFHYVLEALPEILKRYPDTILAVPGESPVCHGKERLRQDSYARYLGELTEKYGLENHIQYLGSLSPEEMKKEYLKANVYVLPSALENSSNSLGEAMLLGVPCAASLAGGTATMLKEGEGLLYQSTAPYMLADSVEQIFSMGSAAEKLGAAAKEHAKQTHDPRKNFRNLLNIYREIGGTVHG